MPGRQKLERTLGFDGVLLFGIAFIAPLGIFAIFGELDQLSKGTPSGAYVLALGAMVLTALSYGRMVTLYPFAGSAYTYVRRAIGGHVGFLVGWAVVLDYLLLPMVSWLVAGVFLAPVFPGIPIWLWVIGLAALTTAVNVAGLVIAKCVNMVLLFIQFLVLIAFIGLAVRYVWLASGPSGLVSVEPFFRADVPISATLAAASLAAISFLGFDAISTLAEETIDPKRTLRRAILSVAIVAGVMFIIISYILVLAHPSDTFRDVQSAAEEIAGAIGGDLFKAFFLIGFVTTQLAGGVSQQASVGRLLFAMGRDGTLPRLFGYLHPTFKTPLFNLVLAGLVGLTGLTIDVETAFFFVNFGAFVAFTFVNLAVIAHALRSDMAAEGGNLLVWFVLPGLGAAADVWLLVNLPSEAHFLGATWLALGIVYLLVLTRGLRRPPPEILIDE